MDASHAHYLYYLPSQSAFYIHAYMLMLQLTQVPVLDHFEPSEHFQNSATKIMKKIKKSKKCYKKLRVIFVLFFVVVVV